MKEMDQSHFTCRYTELFCEYRSLRTILKDVFDQKTLPISKRHHKFDFEHFQAYILLDRSPEWSKSQFEK